MSEMWQVQMSAGRSIDRRARLVLLCGLFAGSLLGGCGNYFGGGVLGAGPRGEQARTPNSELDNVREEDLSARYPQRVKNNVAGGKFEKRKPELYPGDEGALEAGAPREGRDGRERTIRVNPASAGVRQTNDGYQLNFDNANVVDVAKAIFGDTLQQPYIIDPRVQGTITLSTGRAVTREELLKSFEVAVKLANGALIGDKSGYRIIPSGEAAAGDISRIDKARVGEAIPAGYGVTVMPLRHTNGEAMMRLIDGFLARAGSVRAETLGNLLLIRGGSRERESILDVVSTFDVDWLKGQSAGIFPMTNASPDEMITELNQIMQNEPGTLTANQVRFQPIPRLNAILVLTRRVDHLRQVAEWIKRLDKSNAAGQSVYVYQVENGKAADIAALLNDTFGTGGGGSTPRRTPRSEVAPGQGLSQASASGNSSFAGSGAGGQGGQVGGSILRPTGGAAPGQPGGPIQPGRPAAATPIGGGSSGGGASASTIDVKIIPDEANNTLIIRASQADYQKMLATLRQIDKPPLQVMINATIAEVTLNDALRYGVQAYLKAEKMDYGYHAGPSELTLKPTFPGLNLLIGGVSDPRAVLDALSDVTTVKVVSSPSLVVVDNQPATLKVGDEVPISTQQQQSTTVVNGPIINTIRFRETGVILKVTPRVNSSGLVTMEVEQEISQVANANSSSGDAAQSSLTPTISQRRISSTIAVYSGQTVALGGLISDQTNRSRKSVPLLNQIPLVGDLVGKTDAQSKRTELIVFIKPQIIRNGEDASRVSEDLRGKLKSMAFEPERERWEGKRGWSAQTQSGAPVAAPTK